MRGIFIALAACSSASTPPTQQHPPDGGRSGDAANPGADAPSYDNPNGPYFETPMFWNTDVSTTPKSASSDAMIAALVAEGGWGNSNKMQVDFDLDVLTADAST